MKRQNSGTNGLTLCCLRCTQGDCGCDYMCLFLDEHYSDNRCICSPDWELAEDGKTCNCEYSDNHSFAQAITLFAQAITELFYSGNHWTLLIGQSLNSFTQAITELFWSGNHWTLFTQAITRLFYSGNQYIFQFVLWPVKIIFEQWFLTFLKLYATRNYCDYNYQNYYSLYNFFFHYHHVIWRNNSFHKAYGTHVQIL